MCWTLFAKIYVLGGLDLFMTRDQTLSSLSKSFKLIFPSYDDFRINC